MPVRLPVRRRRARRHPRGWGCAGRGRSLAALRTTANLFLAGGREFPFCVTPIFVRSDSIHGIQRKLSCKLELRHVCERATPTARVFVREWFSKSNPTIEGATMFGQTKVQRISELGTGPRRCEAQTRVWSKRRQRGFPSARPSLYADRSSSFGNRSNKAKTSSSAIGCTYPCRPSS
jgi:hypothetical protein